MTCPTLLRKEAGHRPDRVFEPDTRLLITTGKFAEHWIVSTLLLAALGYLLWRDTGMGAFVHHAHIMRTAAL